MRIKSVQKTSLIDYPGQIASIVFVEKCNFCCAYCYNKALQNEHADNDLIPIAEILDLLEKRKKYIDGVVITGGEPTLQEGLLEFAKAIKELGLKVKLDTNGYLPEVLEKLLNENYVKSQKISRKKWDSENELDKER